MWFHEKRILCGESQKLDKELRDIFCLSGVVNKRNTKEKRYGSSSETL
jgi:hypothetical protein